MSPTLTAWRRAILGLAILGWLACFAVVVRFGTWAPFALLGPALAALALRVDPTTRALLRPSLRAAAVGVLAGVLMVLLTHATFRLVTPSLPAIHDATTRLFELLNVGGFSPAARMALIAIIASSEEVIFRGALLGPPGGAGDRSELRRVVALAFAYALAMVTLGSPLLIVAAFGCALIWGWLRVATGSLIAPILTHVLWDLGVLVVWPVVTP